MSKMKFSKSKAFNKQSKFASIDRQQGWTMWSIMFVAGIIVLFSYIGIQLVPVYTTNSNVTNSMKVAIDGLSPNNVSRSAVIRTMTAQLNLDGAVELLDFKKDLVVKRTQRQIIVQVNYERRVELFYNLSLVATFENEVTRDL